MTTVRAIRMHTTGSTASASLSTDRSPRVTTDMSTDLQIGWNASLDIPSALQRVPADRLDGTYALISTIDSTPHVCRLPSLVPLLGRLDVFYETVGDDVVVDAPTLLGLINEHDFLSGFDEIWLCDAVPTTGKPERFRFTSDVSLGPEPPTGLADWMCESTCRAGLGDGDGLNFATFDAELARLWRD